MARDGVVYRDGSLATMTGREQVAALWTAWEDNQTLDFRDVDYDAEPLTHQVRIVDIEEIVDKPADGDRWSEASVRLLLVQV